MNLHQELAQKMTSTRYLYSDAPRNVYWEMTIACDLVCKHCRAESIPCRDPQELTTEDG
jgi:MoaA/NifB/PqqE/SkfB family radical SAM enzyme